jgi:predicted nucleic acid-binding protein
MCEAKVLDTGVMLGVTIEKDAHHELCLDYVTAGEPCYVSPTVREEYKRKEKRIRQKLNEEIINHRNDFIDEVESDPLTSGAIDWICSELLDRDMDSFRYLHKYYQRKRNESRIQSVSQLEIEADLEDMEMEIWEDAAKDQGGAESFFVDWDRGLENYAGVERNLLIYEGDDPQVCLEAHHIAATLGTPTELGTTNTKHFIEEHEGEESSRENNILTVTALESVHDLAWHGEV